ncbi:hypothetical protein [Haloferula sp. A504]|uniref:hypothetical protein n=1 Tax=Haloferula sp. A504 TaxID=3373601 RepID=UPI0031BC6FAF|nr:hypothetical protein [Verrucomicrobiaceae bacterium E54]
MPTLPVAQLLVQATSMGLEPPAWSPYAVGAALGQGNWDALAVIAGLLAGSYLFAECSGWIRRHPRRRGDLGEISIARIFRLGESTTVVVLAVVLVSFLVILELQT